MLTPTKRKDRIQSLDFLRGFAILGILIMNIQSFSMPGAAYFNPTAYGNLEGGNMWVWILSHIFVDQKFMTIFSILFGAGIILVTQNAEAKVGRSAALHYKRTFWLLVIGLIHAHLIWYGDILVPYALCALFVYLFRKKKPWTLLVLGLIFILVHTVINLVSGSYLEYFPTKVLENSREFWIPTSEEINEEIGALTSSLTNQLAHNSSGAVIMETFIFFAFFLWRAGGLMLVGMALYKWEILTAKRSISFYKKGFIISWLIGLPIIIFGIYKNFQHDWALEFSAYFGNQFNYIGSLFVAFGLICIVMWSAKLKKFPWWQNRLAAIGQMALTNYILQSIICVFIFYSIGLGLFGQVNRKWQVIIVLAIWFIQIIWSKTWLRKFHFGPLEWLWRSLTYGKKQPFRKNGK